MKKRAFIILLFLTVILFKSGAQTPEIRLGEANTLYQSGDYSGAAAIYKKIYNEGYRSGILLFNSGNAFYKSGDIASAILFYERARLIAPADEDLDYNLQIARTLVSDKFKEVPQVFFMRWFDFLSLLTSTNKWALVALMLFLVSLASFVFFVSATRTRIRALSFWVSLIAILMSLITISFSIRNNNLVNHNNKAVVMCSILTGTSAPGESGNEIFVIHNGTTVVIENVLGDYTEIRLPDGNKGWVKGDCIERI